MGAKHSKPRLRRDRRCSSIRKRQAPEGSNDPIPPPIEVYNCGNTNKSQVPDDSCKFCGAQDSFHGNSLRIRQLAKTCDNDVKKADVHPEKTALYNTGYTTPGELLVNLPRTGKIDCCRRWENNERSMTLPIKSTLPGPNRQSVGKYDEQEWTITLYEIDKTSNLVPREDMEALMSSIYEAVNEKADESPQCRKTVRVRLSVTPERTTHSRLQGFSSENYKEQAGCRCANCPKTEPSSRKGFNESKIRLHRCDSNSPIRNSSGQSTRPAKHDTHRNPRDYFVENNEKLKHSSLHKTDSNNTPISNKHHLPPESRVVLDRTKSLPQSRHRPFTKADNQRHAHNKSTRHKRNFHVNDSRNVSTRGRRKEPKFASPYDQHFQEAMYLRLRELQRQGAFERRRAVGAQDSDDADDDSDLNDDLNKQIKQEESHTSRAHETDDSSSKTHETAKLSNNNAERNCCPVAVETVHHHHYIYHNSSHEAAETPQKLSVDCIENAVKTIQSEIDDRDNPPGQSHHIHYHHYHLADTS